MPEETKGWTARRRKQQACNIRRNKPWQKSTGPKSEKGKRRASMNAVKHGRYAAEYAILREALRHNREFIRFTALYYTAAHQLAEILEKKQSEEKPGKIKDHPPPPVRI